MWLAAPDRGSAQQPVQDVPGTGVVRKKRWRMVDLVANIRHFYGHCHIRADPPMYCLLAAQVQLINTRSSLHFNES